MDMAVVQKELDRLDQRLHAVEQVNVRFLALEVEVRGVSDDVRLLTAAVTKLVDARELDAKERKADRWKLTATVIGAAGLIGPTVALVIGQGP